MLVRGSLFGKHFLQTGQHGVHRFGRQRAQVLHQPLTIDGPQLIEDDVSGSALEAASDPPRIRASAGRHRRDDDRVEMRVQLVGRYDDARPRLLNLTAKGGVETDEVNVSAGSLPAPIPVVEARRSGDVEHHVVFSLMHRSRLDRPPGSGPCRGADDDAARFGAQFDFFRQVGLIEQDLRYANPARITDTDDACLRGHVITV